MATTEAHAGASWDRLGFRHDLKHCGRNRRNLGVEPPPEKMQFLGTDKVFTLADLKEHYDAIGSYLHVPSLDQFMKSGIPDESKLRARCEAIILLMETVLSSPLWNATFGNFAQFECLRRKKPVRKRMPHGTEEIEATCFECHAQYVVTSVGDHQVSTRPKPVVVPCETDGCVETMALWPDKVKSGTHWTCKGCSEHWAIEFGLIRVLSAEDGSKDAQYRFPHEHFRGRAGTNRSK